MKKFIFLLIIPLFAFTQSSEFRKIENKAFGLGEKLTFDVNYGFVTAGIATFSIPEIKTMAGRKVFRIKFEVNTVPTFDPFFKVRDRYETYLDVEGIFPWRFEQHIREGKYSRDFSAFFDQRRNVAKTSEGTYKIPPYVHDIVSAFFYVRTLDFSNFKKGDKIKLQNFYKDKTYDLEVLYHGKEVVTVKAGKFRCIVVEPLVQEGGLFKSEGSILIWLTDDDVKMPVKVKTKVVIGAIDSELTAYEGLKSPLKAKL
ncbi:MAG: DUF3108 domain-containing protein [Ignavibacteria bacterium]|nr:DUF3108 domain-containing protein [Ignavibacteria bacterium]